MRRCSPACDHGAMLAWVRGGWRIARKGWAKPVAALGGLGCLAWALAPALTLGAPQPLHLELADPSVLVHAVAVQPEERHPNVNLGVVRWTAPRRETFERLAGRWGMRAKTLRRLNPDLEGSIVEAGQVLVVSRSAAQELSRSVGSPNRGRLRNGVAFPESDAWALRPWRPHGYGTTHTVAWLAAVLRGFAERFPDAPPIVIGDLSRRYGGRAPPHKSHQSGRDVDLGYVTNEPLPPNGRWAEVDLEHFDAYENWVLVRSLLASGTVEQIYVDRRIQAKLVEEARRELDPDALARTFSVVAHGRRAQATALVRSWPGHDDHMHIRFACTPSDLRCGQAFRRKSKKKKKARKR